MEMVSNLIKQVILSSKMSLCHTPSRFLVSSLHSSLDRGATEQEGSYLFLSLMWATFSSALLCLSTLTSLTNSLWSFSGLRTSLPCAAHMSSFSLAAMDSWPTLPHLTQGRQTENLDTPLSNCRTIRIAVMDGCLFAMEIIGNYINGPLFKQ